jgi:hypothetical protein
MRATCLSCASWLYGNTKVQNCVRQIVAVSGFIAWQMGHFFTVFLLWWGERGENPTRVVSAEEEGEKGSVLAPELIVDVVRGETGTIALRHVFHNVS